jgi:hypothetical protein
VEAPTYFCLRTMNHENLTQNWLGLCRVSHMLSLWIELVIRVSDYSVIYVMSVSNSAGKHYRRTQPALGFDQQDDLFLAATWRR